MNNILLIPLDERPCNYDFPAMLANDTDFRLVMPPRELLGKKKQPGDIDGIWQWLEKNISDCTDAIISIDTLLFSGIVPSRLHSFTPEVLINRLNQLKKLKEINPNLKIYAFNLIMRNPSYSSSDEEPDYYGQWGLEIHRHGLIEHKIKLSIVTDQEMAEYEDINKNLPQEYLTDYLERRQINLQVNKKAVELAKEGLFDFLIFPQDDSTPYGVTAEDQQIIRQQIDDLNVNLTVYMYPDADAVENTLLARVINRRKGRRPLIYVKYSSSIGHAVIPLYEDRIVSETIKYQVLAAGGLVVSSASESELILLVNIPGGNMRDHLGNVENGQFLRRSIEYDAFRNLVDLVEYADYAIHVLKKPVIMADIAYANGGDPLLLNLMRQKGLLWNLSGYAGWNTSSNTLGTCIPMGMIYNIYKDTKAHTDFLALRFLEDIGYCSLVRRDITANALLPMGFRYEQIDGQRGTIADLVKGELQKFADANLNDESHTVTVTDCYMPWCRMFEAGIKAEVKKIPQ